MMIFTLRWARGAFQRPAEQTRRHCGTPALPLYDANPSDGIPVATLTSQYFGFRCSLSGDMGPGRADAVSCRERRARDKAKDACPHTAARIAWRR